MCSHLKHLHSKCFHKYFLSYVLLNYDYCIASYYNVNISGILYKLTTICAIQNRFNWVQHNAKCLTFKLVTRYVFYIIYVDL